jgi:hypothetical protein
MSPMHSDFMEEIRVLPSAARTVAPQPQLITNQGGRMMHLVVDVTAVSGTSSLTVAVDYEDRASLKWVNILTALPFTAIETRELSIGPGLAAAPNVSANHMLPLSLRVRLTHGDSSSTTYSIGATIGG